MKTPDQAVEPELYPDQRATEVALLATLATVINGDLSELKYDILRMAAEDFHFRDHRDIFAAMQALADAGDHVDQVTVRARIGDVWPETLAAVFDAEKADAGAAPSYKRLIQYRAEIGRARKIGAAFMATLDQAEAKEADLPGLVAELQKAVFDMARTDRIAPSVMNEAELTDRFVLSLTMPTPGYKTGFAKLEGIIRGLTSGLFVIAAPPSAGKTTFAKQLADQIAELNDVPVLFFSYEQSADELRVKSLARISRANRQPVSNEDIKDGKETAAVEAAAKAYKRFAKWITVIEGDRYHTIDKIRFLALREKQLTGKTPVLIIDYLQILPVADSVVKDRRIEIDYLISDLRRISRDIGSPVIAISAMSRAEYARTAMSGFKESSGIEYGSDIAAILSVEDEADSPDKYAGKKRTVKLNIIKNRNGRRGFVRMIYFMDNDCFEEMETGFVNYMETIGKETNQ